MSYIDTAFTIFKKIRKLNKYLQDVQYISRYLDELGFHNTIDKINVYRDNTTSIIFEDTKDNYGSFSNCKEHVRNMQHDNKVNNLDDEYKLIKPLGGGKSGAYVFLAKDIKTDKDVVLKLYTLRLLNPRKLVDRDLREIFISCTLSGTNGFPKVYNFGYTYFDRSSSFWKGFSDDLSICPDPAFIKPNLYNKCYFLVSDFFQGKSLEKINLLTLSPKTLIDILHQIKDLLVIATKKIPKFIHKDLHPGNILINEDMKVTIIDFDIANSAQFKYNLDSFRSHTGYILPQEALLDMLVKYIGIKNTFYLVEKTAPLASFINSDFRIWYVYKILFEVIIIYKLTNMQIDTTTNSIPPHIATKLIKILLHDQHQISLCESLKNCELDYFSKLTMQETDFTPYIKSYFANIINNYKLVTKKNDIALSKSLSKVITQMIENAERIIGSTLEEKIFAAKNATKKAIHKVTSIIKNKHYQEFINQLKTLGSNLENFEEMYYEKYNKHLEFNDFHLVFNMQFENYKLPIHNNYESMVIHANSKNQDPNDGINIYLTTSKITIKFNNVDIKVDNISYILNKHSIRGKLPFGNSLTNMIVNNVIKNMSEIEYNFAKQTIKLDANSTLSLTKILAEYTQSESGSKKVHRKLQELDCEPHLNLIEFITKDNFMTFLPLLIYIIQNLPSQLRISLQLKKDPSFSKEVNIKFNYEFVQNIIFMLDDFISGIIGDKFSDLLKLNKNRYSNSIKSSENMYHIDTKFTSLFLQYVNPNEVKFITTLDDLLKYNNTQLQNTNFIQDEKLRQLVHYMNTTLINNLNNKLINTKNKYFENNTQADPVDMQIINEMYTELQNFKNITSYNDLLTYFDQLVNKYNLNANFFTYIFNKFYGENANYKLSYEKTGKIYSELNDIMTPQINEWYQKYYDELIKKY